MPIRPFDGFGGGIEQPSELIDAGEWRRIGDFAVSSVVSEPTMPRDEARRLMELAVAAVEEVLKFIPDHELAVPERAFWSERGRAFRDREPILFHRSMVQLSLDTCLHLLQKYQ